MEEEARELAWRAAVRHRYRALLGAALTRGWRRYVVARRARRDERAAAQRAWLLARRGALLARWRDAAALRALCDEQLVAADAVAMAAGKRRALPRWAAAAVARREVRHACGMAAARARRGLCARVLAAWLGYACRRASKHDMQVHDLPLPLPRSQRPPTAHGTLPYAPAAHAPCSPVSASLWAPRQVTRLLALRRTLDGALRARVLGAWTALHRAKAARRCAALRLAATPPDPARVSLRSGRSPPPRPARSPCGQGALRVPCRHAARPPRPARAGGPRGAHGASPRPPAAAADRRRCGRSRRRAPSARSLAQSRGGLGARGRRGGAR